MWTPGGQRNRLTFAGLRGGGKGGGGGDTQPAPPQVYTDPVNGMSFTDDPYWKIAQSPDNIGGSGVKSGAQKLNEEIAARQAQEKATSDATTAQNTADAATKEQTFQTNRQTAYDSAMQNAIRAFQLQGVDPNTYMASDITPALQRQFSSIQDLDPNPSAAFPTNLGDTIVNQVLGGKRTQAMNSLNSVFTPTYSSNMLPDSTTGNYVSGIVNEQFDPLQSQLQNALKRHTLNDAGYQAALDSLNQKKSAATATVQNLGQGILSSDRSALDDYISGARSDVNSLNLASPFDPSSYAGKASGMVQTDLSNFGGALRNAVGDTKFSTIGDLINAGGAVQGATNPNAANPTGAPGADSNLSPSFVAQDELAKRQRGLGNTGAF